MWQSLYIRISNIDIFAICAWLGRQREAFPATNKYVFRSIHTHPRDYNHKLNSRRLGIKLYCSHRWVEINK